MPLFHVSTEEYKIGQIILSSNFNITNNYKNAIQNHRNWIDDFLDSIKPEFAPERKKSLFAFDSLKNCKAYSINSPKKSLHYYEVKMKDFTSCPMCLIDAFIINDNVNNKKIAIEYWYPTKKWKFLEFLSTEMKVIKKMKEPNFIIGSKGKIDYNYDCNLRKEFIKNL